MSSDEPRHSWLEIHGEGKGSGIDGLSVSCPYRGECALSTCISCREFTGLQPDSWGRPLFCGCKKAEAAPREAFVILERNVRDPEGAVWKVTAYGRQRHDGSWDGWLEWLSPDERRRRCSGCETNERSREGLSIWAEGLSAWSCRGFLMAREALPRD